MAVAPPTPGQVGWLQRVASRAVLGYIRNSPLERGKYRLARMALAFLAAELDRGVFLRITDLNHVELEVIRAGLFERDTVEVFTSLLAPGMTVLDVGANVGQYTLIAANRVGGGGSVHAFEPTPVVAASLRRNVAINGFPNVVVNEVAVSDAAGWADLYFLDSDSPVENTIVARAGGRPVPSVRVPTVTLDGYVRERGLARVDVIKMDIEGAEVLALRGAADLLSGDRSPILVMELNPNALLSGDSSSDETLGLLERHGYSYYPVARYNARKANPYSNGVVAKPAHWDRFPALARWVGPPRVA